MAEAVATLPADPERVFAVLSDSYTYDDWVIGVTKIRDADETWPAPGSRLHHRVGVGPVGIHDHTEVLSSEPPHRLVLRSRVRPLATARVTIELTPEGVGTRVRMTEVPGDPVSRLLHNPVFDRLTAMRNVRALARLARVVAGSG